MAGRAKFILIALISLFGIDLHAQGIPYQLNPPAPNARVQFCPVPDGGYPCPTLTTVYSDSATTQVINQPISTGSSGNLSVYFAAGTSSVTVQLLGQGYGPQNRFIVSLGASGVAPNNPLPGVTSGPGPVFNVKNYGAFGDTQQSLHGTSDGTTATITCSDCAFSTAKDVTVPQKAIFLVNQNGTTSAWSGAGVIAHIVSVTNATTVVTDTVTANAISNGSIRWGRLDDTAFTTATTAALAAAHLVQQANNIGITTAAPTIYMPAGSYLGCTSLGASMISLGPTSGIQQLHVKGDGSGATSIYAGDAPACAYNSNIAWFLAVGGNVNSMDFIGMTIDGADNSAGGKISPAISSGGFGMYVHDIAVTRSVVAQVGISAPSFSVNNGTVYGDRIAIIGNGGPFLCKACLGEIESGVFSNNGGSANSAATNLAIQNVNGSPFGPGFRIGKGVLVDECGASTVGCTQIINSEDVWFIGPGIFGTPNSTCLSVDGNSYVHFNGGLCGLFSTDTNVNGPNVAAGGVLEESDVRNVSSGTGKCAIVSGTLLNNGSNTCESLFSIASGSESVNTASLTVTTQGANVSTNCAIGDTALVEGVINQPGYNGKFKFAITAVGTNTLSYTNPTSGLSAIGAQGAVSCLHNRSTILTGVPTQTLAPSQFNCNIPTLTATTTTATTNCFFTPDRDIYVTRLSAGLGTTPVTCTTAAILQVTNGTNSTNLTLTNAAAQDDSGAITGVLMSANTKVGVIVQTAASGCGTSPANAAVNFFWMAAFDN